MTATEQNQERIDRQMQTITAQARTHGQYPVNQMTPHEKQHLIAAGYAARR